MWSKNKIRVGEKPLRNISNKTWIVFLWIFSFGAGMLFLNRMWMRQEGRIIGKLALKNWGGNLTEQGYKSKFRVTSIQSNTTREVSEIYDSIKKINQSPFEDMWFRPKDLNTQRKYCMVIGIHTAFGNSKKRESIRATWMPQGDKRKRIEEEKGIVIRFIIGHSAKSGGLLDHSTEEEEKLYGDFMRLDHTEAYLALAAKTKLYFATAVETWDADFYIKVDDDVHVNIGALKRTLYSHIHKPHVYIGCMKSGHVLSEKGVKYREPEFWKFGNMGNHYFRHAGGQIYALSNKLATYISENKDILHTYVNEDVSLGSWMIGLNVEHVDDRSFCCGTAICEWKKLIRHTCVATLDYTCTGICNSQERIRDVHNRCSEDENELWI